VVVSAVVFREGDWVTWGPGEGRVSYVDEEGRGIIAATGRGSSISGPEDMFTLLRRPVRVGDLVTWGYKVRNEKVVEVCPGGVVVDYGPSGSYFVSWGGNASTPIVHADGTPIDPPQAKEPEAPKDYERHAIDYAANQMRAQAQQSGLAMQAAAMAQARSQTRTVLPTAEQLARAVFETDPRVIDMIFHCADAWIMRDGEQVHDEARERAALQRAWDRDDLCARTEAEARAAQILDALRGTS
jgi:hypothetical protein